MRKLFGLIPALFLFTGCASLVPDMVKSVVSRFDVSASGGPAVMAGTLPGGLKTTRGGFTVVDDYDAMAGIISNETEGEQKDVYLYVRTKTGWQPACVTASVKIPGHVLIDGEDVNLGTPWMTVECLSGIHFDTPFMQRVALQARTSNGASEIVFDTAGRRLMGTRYQRVNDLMMRLPRGEYRLDVYTYTGSGVFHHAKGLPNTRSLSVGRSGSSVAAGNQMVAWYVRL